MAALQAEVIASKKFEIDNLDDPNVIEAIRVVRRQHEIREGHLWTPPGWKNAKVHLQTDGSNVGVTRLTLLMYPGTKVAITHGPVKPVQQGLIAKTINFYVKNKTSLFLTFKSRDYSGVALYKVITPAHLLDSLKRDALEYDRVAWFSAVELLDERGIEI